MVTSYLSVEEAAAHLNVSVRFIRRLVSERRLRHFKVGKFVRFDRSDLDSFVHSGEVAVGHDELEAQVWSARQRVRA